VADGLVSAAPTNVRLSATLNLPGDAACRGPARRGPPR